MTHKQTRAALTPRFTVVRSGRRIDAFCRQCGRKFPLRDGPGPIHPRGVLAAQNHVTCDPPAGRIPPEVLIV